MFPSAVGLFLVNIVLNMARKKQTHRKYRTKPIDETITALVADEDGNIIELEGFGAAGMAGDALIPLSSRETLTMPHGSELMFLPDRIPVLLDLESGRLTAVPENPLPARRADFSGSRI